MNPLFISAIVNNTPKEDKEYYECTPDVMYVLINFVENYLQGHHPTYEVRSFTRDDATHFCIVLKEESTLPAIPLSNLPDNTNIIACIDNDTRGYILKGLLGG